MSYFADLTPHTYTPTDGATVLNIGWLDEAYSFPRGETTSEFQAALAALCARPIRRHRGFHQCQYCPREQFKFWPAPPSRPLHPERLGNGQIRVRDAAGIWYAAPTLVHHYVTVHEYLPPAVFIETVLHPAEVATDPG